MFRNRNSALLAVTLLAGSLGTTVAASNNSTGSDSGERSAASLAKSDPSSRRSGSTWKTFNTPIGRGTKIVVTTAGNIDTFTSPNQAGASYQHVYSEGYVLCYSGQTTPAYDVGVGEESSGFASPTTSASAVMRNTLDGRVTLTQTFALKPENATGPTNFAVTMTLKNRTSSPLTNVVLRRQVDFDLDSWGPQGWANAVSNHSRTKATVTAFHDPVEAPSGREAHGIMIMNTSPGNWDTRVTSDYNDNTCNPAAAPLGSGYVSRGDYGDTVIFKVGTIPGNGSKTVALRYIRF